MNEGCPDDNELTSLVEGRLSGAQLLRLEEHVDSCSSCTELLADLAAVLSPSEASAPSKLNRYQLVGELGSGAQGVVHEAYDRQLGRRVALKRIRPDLALTSPQLMADARLRLEREARLLAGLSHPNVVALFDVQSEGEEIVLVQELVLGEPLDVWLRGRSRAIPALLEVFAQAAAGLHAAHGAGVTHRDVKPANVLVGHDGRVRVTDFGLARAGHVDTALTHTGAAVGTPAYMAPEQLAGRPADARSDQYSLAVALAEALTGERPLPGATADQLAESQRSNAREPLDSDLLEALATALAVQPAQRFADIAAFAERLRGAPSSSNNKVIDARTLHPPPSPTARPGSAPRVALIALLGAGVAGGFIAWRQSSAVTTNSAAPSNAEPQPTITPSSISSPGPTPSALASLAPSASELPGQASPGRSASALAPNQRSADLLLLDARSAKINGDPAACVTHHQAIASADAAFAAMAPLQRERAECEMLAGQCEVGRKRLRGLIVNQYSAAELESALNALTPAACQKPNASAPVAPVSAINADDARKLVAAAQEAWKAGDVARCRSLGNEATRLARPGLPQDVSVHLSNVIAMTSECMAKNGDCATARKNFTAQYPKLYPQLVANGLDEAQRETMFKASFPNCAKSP
jgi:serine/threonine protein kinase